MDISIVMSVYNGEEYVLDSIQSILNQTYPHFEFIIIDDCSTDQTKNILSGITDPRVKIFALEENKGQTFSLNYGIDHAKGDWIFRQDADDISLPERIQKQLAFIKQHPDTIAVGTQISSISAKRKVSDHTLRAIQWSNTLLTREEIKRFRYIAPPVVHGTMAFSKKAFISAGKYNENYRIGQDFDLWNRLLEIGPIDKVPEILYYYRVDPESISRKDETKTCHESLLISTFHIKNLLKKKLNREPFFIVSGPKAGCEYFKNEIASENQLLVLSYLEENENSNYIVEKYHKKFADGIIILDGKYSDQHVTELEQKGLTFNFNLYRLWNIYNHSIIQDGTKKNDLFVSVIVPCYNSSSVIKDSVLSLSRQTISETSYEIIVVDDASTDHSIEVLNKLKVKNLKIICHTQNKGAAGARNTGVGHAKGELIIFCDSDFIVPPWFIENHIKQHKDQEMVAVSGLGHWKYIITHDYKDMWSSYEKEAVKEYYEQPFIKNQLLQSQNNHFINEMDIYNWNLEPYSFCPDYLNEWVIMVEDIFETFGANLDRFNLPWLTFCTGNISLWKNHFIELGQFDESFKRLEDWEFGYRFYKNGGKFMFGKDCEAYQQLGPISPRRNHLQKNAYQMFCSKHPEFEVHLLSLLLFKNFSFKQLSKIFEQHQLIKQNYDHSQKIVDHLEHALYLFSNGQQLPKMNSQERLNRYSLNKIKLFYLEWANLFQMLTD
jgi:glycosyltransferase involved in cell wall biosynthesis